MNISLNSNMMNFGKTHRQKFGFMGMLFMLAGGGIFLAGGILLGRSAKVDPGWTTASGQVISFVRTTDVNSSLMYTPTVSYSVNGRAYSIQSSTSTSKMPSVGQAEKVAYDPAHPENSKVVETSTTTISYIFSAVGALFIIIAPIAYFRSRHRSGQIDRLKQSGLKVQGIVSDIRTVSNVSTNNNVGGGYKIVVTASDAAGNSRQYISDSLTGIGGLAMADFQSHPFPVDVYLDPVDPDNYYVDVEDIPNLTPDRIKDIISSLPKIAAQNGITGIGEDKSEPK